MKIKILILMLLLFIIYYNYNVNSTCLIPLYYYPQLQLLNTNLILKELINIINSDKWIIYDDFHNKQIFHNNNIKSITDILLKNQSTLNSTNEPTWRLFPLLYNKQVFNNHDILCPNTIKMLLKIPYVINAGFSCLEAGKITDYHTDNNKKYYRYQLPLIIPKGNCKFKLVNKILDWSYPFIFNDNCYHQVWNLTTQNRFVLILDILR